MMEKIQKRRREEKRREEVKSSNGHAVLPSPRLNENRRE